MRMVKCPICKKEFNEKDKVCPICFAGKSQKEKEIFAEMLSIPDLRKVLSMTPSQVLQLLDDEDDKKKARKEMKLGGPEEFLDKMVPEFKKVMSLIREIPLEPEEATIFDDYFHGSRLGQPERVQKALKRLDLYFPNEGAIWEELIPRDFLTKEHSQLEFYKKINLLIDSLEKNPNIHFKWGVLGFLYLKVNEYDKALECSDNQMKLEPNNLMPLKFMSIIYDLKGNLPKAIECQELYLKAYPNDVSVQNVLKKLNLKLHGKGETEKFPLQPRLRSRMIGKIFNFLKDNKGKAFTVRALNIRVENILEELNEREYFRKNLQNILKGMISDGWIKSVQNGEEIHYFFQG